VSDPGISRKLSIRTIVIVALCVVLAAYEAWYRGLYTPRLCGSWAVLGGLLLRTWARVYLEKVGIAGAYLAQTWVPTEWVTTGPYRWHRHPMYLGSVVLFAGLGWILTNHWAAGVAVALGVLPHYVWRAAIETALRGGR